MIDLQQENILSMSEAAKRMPRIRSGRRVHIATLYRWATSGVSGVKLETLRVGGTLCTSMEAIQRFAERCTDPSAKPSTSASRRREIRKAERELTAEGI